MNLPPSIQPSTTQYATTLDEVLALRSQLASARKALEEINSQAVCAVIATDGECFDMLQNCAEISDAALKDIPK